MKVGTHPDGSEIFVGRGPSYDEIVPGRLAPGRGLFIPGELGEELLTKFVSYLHVEGTCNCRFEACKNSNCTSLEGEIVTTNANILTYWISRELVAYDCEGSSCEFSTVGVVSPTLDTVAYADEAGDRLTRGAPYDVLVCDKVPDFEYPDKSQIFGYAY